MKMTIRILLASAAITIAPIGLPAQEDAGLSDAILDAVEERVDRTGLVVASRQQVMRATGPTAEPLSEEMQGRLAARDHQLLDLDERLQCPTGKPRAACALPAGLDLVIQFGTVERPRPGRAAADVVLLEESPSSRQPISRTRYRVSLQRTGDGWSVIDWKLISVS